MKASSRVETLDMLKDTFPSSSIYPDPSRVISNTGKTDTCGDISLLSLPTGHFYIDKSGRAFYMRFKEHSKADNRVNYKVRQLQAGAEW
jgi:hypothetical protein